MRKKLSLNNKSATRREFIKSTAMMSASAIATNVFTQRALAADPNIKRVAFWYVPEGAAQQAFWPSFGPGPLNINMDARIDGLNPKSFGEPFNNYARRSDNSNGIMGTYCLQPLKPHEQDLTLISGFKNKGASASDPHKQVVQNALTGGVPSQGSIDQHLGDFLKGTSPYHAILSSVYGEHVNVGVGTDYASPFRTKRGVQGNLSWNPVTTYKQIFPNGIPSGGGLSTQVRDHNLDSRLAILGDVASQIEMVRCAGGLEAQKRLEAYLESYENIEKITQDLADAQPPLMSNELNVDVPEDWLNINSNNKYWHDPNNFGRMTKIQIDTTVAAFALDRTRVSLMQFSATGTSKGIDGSHYKRVGISGLEGQTVDHHLGHDPDPVRRRDQARIFRWYYGQLAYFIERLKSIPEGSGTLFDNTLIVCCSEFGMYNHRANDLPYILVGNPGNIFRKGEYIDAYNGGFRNHSDFLLGICRAMGMNINRFGESTNPYTGMLV